MSEYRIMPNDIVRHKPSGETWVVCGVNHEKGTLIPCGYPFPSMAHIDECVLVERSHEPQTDGEIRALKGCGLDSYIERR